VMIVTSTLTKIGLLLAIIGAVAWGIVGIWQYNFIAAIFGSGNVTATWGERVVYMVIGAGGLIALPLFLASFRRRAARDTMQSDVNARGYGDDRDLVRSDAGRTSSEPVYAGERPVEATATTADQTTPRAVAPVEDLGSERVDEEGHRWRRVA
jgi:uncharacterized protein